MKVLVLIAAMLILAMVLKALDSLTSNHDRTKIDLNNTKTVQEGLAHYKELED